MVEGTPKGAEKKREKEVAAMLQELASPIFTVPLFETRADGQTVTQDGGALVTL
jgi:hypothetical protein